MSALAPGFVNSVHDSQRVFRCVLDAMARPGTVHRLDVAIDAPAPLGTGAAALALALLDYETPVWLEARLAGTQGVGSWLRFHTGAPITTDPARAAFGFVLDAAAAPPLESLALGSTEYPDRSATLVVGVTSLEQGVALRLAGPGIRGTATLRVSGEAALLVPALQRNQTLFPRGIDIVFVRGPSIAAIPRSTRVVMLGES